MRKIQDPMEQGWAYASQLAGTNASTVIGADYVGKINEAIESTAKSLNELKSNLTDSSMGGFVAERWHAGSYNVRAVASGSKNIAIAGDSGTIGDLGRNNYGSVDVRVQTSEGTIINDYGSKYMVNAKETAKAQAAPSKNANSPKYHNQMRLNPSDQNSDIINYASHRAANEKTPENWREGYREVAENSTDRISDGKISSKPLSKKESEEIARKIKDDNLDLAEHGLNADDAIKPEYIMKQATKAGLTAAAITALIQTAPDIYRAIDYLIKTGNVDINQLKKIGFDAIQGAAEGFLRGFVACTIQILCDSGKLGKALIDVDPTCLGTIVSLTIQTIKNSVQVACGKMTMRQMGASLIDSVVISAGYIVGAKIGGAVGAALGFEMPVFGYLLGSLIGCALGATYDFGKKKLISFCVESGFTCFGLVEQDYKIPNEMLKEMGIDISEIERINVDRSELNTISIDNSVNRSNVSTIEIKILKRGLIRINKIGYTN